MRNFILFIKRFFNLILFLGLEVVCIVLIAHTNTLQGNDLVSSANFVTGLAYKKQSDVAYYFSLGDVNKKLLDENAQLRRKLTEQNSVDTLKDTLVQVKVSTDTTKHIVRYADYVYHTARVINNSTNLRDNYITINRGTKDGVGKNMAVITGSGVVGRVEHVSAHFASVLSVLSSQLRVSARLKGGTVGSVVWDEKGPDILTMIDVPQQINVKKGDSVYTSNLSLHFPPDVLMGIVTKTEVKKKNATQDIFLQSSANFHNLQYVYVVENKMAGERKRLEDSSSAKK